MGSTPFRAYRPSQVKFAGFLKVCHKRKATGYSMIFWTDEHVSFVVPLRCIVASEYGLAAALTTQQAIVWPYSSRLSSSDPSSVVTLMLPEPSTKSTDPLPFGTFIPGSATADTGLVVVVPSTGKITFWETLSRNYVVGLTKHKQNGIRGSLTGMMSGEFVINILNAEPAGIILTLSTGRIAHVDLRDGEGKPGISTRFLEANPSSIGGFFGGLRNALVGATRRRKIAATRVGRSIQRGQRDVVVVTSTGSVETWDIRWNNGSRLKTEVDVMPDVVEALRNVSLPIEDDRLKDSICVLDSVLREDPGEEPSASQEAVQGLSMWLLVSVSSESTTSYFVAGLELTEDRQAIGPIRPVSYNAPSRGIRADWTPKLYVPKPESVAFVTFADTIALLFLHPVEENSPSEDNLLNGRVSAPFQDTIRLKRSSGYSILGCGQEDASDEKRLPSCILMIRNCGLVRISFASNWMDKPFDSSTTVKSRLEQIVFFEDSKNNPIDFHEYQELHGSISSLEEAALEISDEIVQSTSDYISNTVPSIEKQMEQRAVALNSLATYLSKQTETISYPGRWNLLWNAERLAAHQSIWKVYESTKRGGPPDKKTFLEETLGNMSESFTTIASGDHDRSEIDRHWFINETLNVQFIVHWVLGGARNSYNDSAPITPRFVDQIWQASEISLALLSGAFQFRQDNAKKYRLLNGEKSVDGQPQPSYEQLPEFWTSTASLYAETEKLLDAELNICIKQMRHGVRKGDGPGSIQSKVDKIKENVPKEFELLVQIYKEKTQWCAAQSDVDVQMEGEALEKSHIQRRKNQLYKMAAIGLLEEAIHLAEKHRDMVALVELMVELQDQIKQKETQEVPGTATTEDFKNELSLWRKRIDNYFDRYGEEWAEAFFTRQLHFGQPVMLLIMKEYREYATHFLRKRPGYNNLGWMNEVLAERDYQKASELLADLAISPDTDLWAKRVKLSMAKLSTLAASEADPSANPASGHNVADLEDQSELAVIQEMLYDHVQPCTHGAIDQGAEIQLANDQFAKELVSSKPALREALHRGMAKLVIGRPMESNELIDLLTLMDPVEVFENQGPDIFGHEFVLALRVLKLDGTFREQHKYREALENIIWRRCMIRDDWTTVGSISSKSDEEIDEELWETCLYSTIRDYVMGKMQPTLFLLTGAVNCLDS